MNKSREGQRKRIMDLLTANPNRELDAVMLHRIGSGNSLGFCASISKRISECRSEIEQRGGRLILSKDETVNGQRQTGYTYVPKQ